MLSCKLCILFRKKLSYLFILCIKFFWNFSSSEFVLVWAFGSFLWIILFLQFTNIFFIFSREVCPLDILLLLSLEDGWIGVDDDCRFCCIGATLEVAQEVILEVALTTVIALSQNLPLLQAPHRYFLWRPSQADLCPHLQVFLSFLQFLNQPE